MQKKNSTIKSLTLQRQTNYVQMYSIYTSPSQRKMTQKTLSPLLYACSPHMFCNISWGWTWEQLSEHLFSDTTAVWGPGESKKKIMAEKLRHSQTFSSRRLGFTWKGSICWSTLSEIIISVNWLRHSAYQCRADILCFTEIRSSYCCPIKTLLNTQLYSTSSHARSMFQ